MCNVCIPPMPSVHCSGIVRWDCSHSRALDVPPGSGDVAVHLLPGAARLAIALTPFLRAAEDPHVPHVLRQGVQHRLWKVLAERASTWPGWVLLGCCCLLSSLYRLEAGWGSWFRVIHNLDAKASRASTVCTVCTVCR